MIQYYIMVSRDANHRVAGRSRWLSSVAPQIANLLENKLKLKRSTGLVAMLSGCLALLAASMASAAEPRVVVTLKPVHSVVAAVMAGVAEPHLLLDGTASPHAYAMKPSDMRKLQSAVLVVRVSEHLEAFLTKSLDSLGKRVVIVTLDKLPGMTLHPLRSGGAFDAHEHGDKAHKHGHKHGSDRKSGTAAEAGGPDPHLWLDPTNAAVIAAAIAETLARSDPPHAQAYRDNARALETRLTEAADRIARDVKPLAGKPYLVFHDAYQYFEHRFGLAAIGAVTVSPEVPPSARRLTTLRARVKASGARCIFAEPQFPPRIIASIVEGTAVRQAVLDPLGASHAAGPDQYFHVLDALAKGLTDCLGAAD